MSTKQTSIHIHQKRKFLSVFFIFTYTLFCSYSTASCVVDYSKIDLSITPSLNVSTKQRIFLISFAHGETHERNQNYLALSAINKGIDTIISYRKRHISPEFSEQNKVILSGLWGCGWWLWKPYFILETLKIMAPNDILIYVDAGAYLTKSIEPLLEQINKPDTTMLLFENTHTNRRHVKRDTFDIMEVDYKHRDDAQLNAAFMVIKKTPSSYAFVEKWLEYCCIGRAITGDPSIAPEFEDFESHRNDQAILTLLRIKYQDPTIKVLRRHADNWKTPINIFFHHRRRVPDKPVVDFTG